MDWTNIKSICGFSVQTICDSKELNGKCIYLKHDKTGAEVFFLNNGSENKVFSIAFRTIPENHTGVFHILEHSVLCGSEHYPVKEPFVELLKGSMNTFLNAMTFADMTMYPVASRNNKDLLNLSSVYLDAVFHPAILTNPQIFRQEGWHLEEDDTSGYVYKGVVFNEMKGALSNPDNLISEKLMCQLFPDTGYGFISGGDPEYITDLTYEEFVDTYKRFYHPGNARIYIEGEAPIEELLALINDSISGFDCAEEIPSFVYQTPKGSDQNLEFELGKDESEENRGHLTVSRLLGSWKDKTLNMAAFLICDALTGNNDAPLTRLILEKGLAQDISLSVDDTCLQSWFTIHAENVTDGKEQEILDLLESFGDELSKTGLNREDLEASLNRFAFALKEDEDPNGINRCIRSMGTWLYGGDPLEALENENNLCELRSMLEDGRMNELACTFFKRSASDCVLRVHPSHTKGEELLAKEKKKISDITSVWNAEQSALNKRLNDELTLWQSTPDTEEQLASLPTLGREDVNTEVSWTETCVSDTDGIQVLYHPLPCGGIIHLKVYFKLTDISLDDLTKIGLLSGMLGHLDTEHYDAYTLQREIKKNVGRLGFAVQSRSPGYGDSACTPRLVAFASVLQENFTEAVNLIVEILTSTKLNQEDRILEYIRQNEIGLRQKIVSAGHVIGVRNVLSHYSSEGAALRALEGDIAIRYNHEFATKPDMILPDFLNVSKKILKNTICKKRMLVSVTGDAMPDIRILTSAFPEGTNVPASISYAIDSSLHTGWIVPAQIGYAVRGYRLNQIGKEFDGSLLLISNILSLSYLWNRVRVQGGAYGAGLQIDLSGNVFSYSYRDPSPEKTLQADSGASSFIREFVQGNEKLDNFIISTLNDLDPLLSVRQKANVADNFYMDGMTKERYEKIRMDIIQADENKLMDACEWLDVFADNGAVCVVGNQQILERIPRLDCQDL